LAIFDLQKLRFELKFYKMYSDKKYLYFCVDNDSNLIKPKIPVLTDL